MLVCKYVESPQGLRLEMHIEIFPDMHFEMLFEITFELHFEMHFAISSCAQNTHFQPHYQASAWSYRYVRSIRGFGKCRFGWHLLLIRGLTRVLEAMS